MKPSEALRAATFYAKTWRTPRRTFSRMDRYRGVMSTEWAHVSNKLSNLRLLLPVVLVGRMYGGVIYAESLMYKVRYAALPGRVRCS
jgi:hypothetical protein